MLPVSSFFTKILAYVTFFFLLIGAAFGGEKIDLSDLPVSADASCAEEAYPQRYKKTLRSPALGAFAKRVDGSRSQPIPGIRYTAVTVDGGGISLCDAMTAQGVCLAGEDGEYLLISAYCNDEALENSAYHKDIDGKHESVIYVLDAADETLLTTATVDSYSDSARANKTGAPPHAGGIAYDGTHLWIAKTNGVLAVEFAQLESLIQNGEKTGRVTCVAAKETFVGADGEPVEEFCSDEAISAFKLDARASFVSVCSGLLLVGEYQTGGEAALAAYRTEFADGRLTMTEAFRAPLPLHAQGAYLLERNGRTYLFVTVSAGNVEPGTLFVYRLSVDGGEAKTGDPVALLALPNLCEDLDFRDGRLYICYESAANVYYAWKKPADRTVFPCDRITAIDVDGLF
ncbi:MAG: hypothetical protein IJL26_02665 [Clostridia bacterium]|nr:hypothetical protein [Clostridia bacterium]